jgi:transcriptional regulator with XRE-family HTH domain
MHDQGDALRKWREANNMSQREVGEKLGIHQVLVCRFESGERELSEIAAIRLERLTSGTLKAVDCVLESRRDRLTEVLSGNDVVSTDKTQGAA